MLNRKSIESEKREISSSSGVLLYQGPLGNSSQSANLTSKLAGSTSYYPTDSITLLSKTINFIKGVDIIIIPEPNVCAYAQPV